MATKRLARYGAEHRGVGDASYRGFRRGRGCVGVRAGEALGGNGTLAGARQRVGAPARQSQARRGARGTGSAEAVPAPLRRRLGLVRSSSARAPSKARAAAGQRFGYVIVVDFEATCWSEAGRRGPEISECGGRGVPGGAEIGEGGGCRGPRGAAAGAGGPFCRLTRRPR